MAGKGKRYEADLKARDGENARPLTEAVQVVKNFKQTKFDQSIELCAHLGIDPKQADQALRGSVSLPHGIGKSKRVIAFCQSDVVEAAKANGAVEAGAEELVKKIEEGWMDFDVAIASPDMMRIASKLGRQLGPRGLMPSPKNGTVTPDVAKAVKEYVAGKVDFRNDDGGNVHAVIGKQSFTAEQLTENAQAIIDLLLRIKPTSSKGTYLKKLTLSGTMTPGVEIAV